MNQEPRVKILAEEKTEEGWYVLAELCLWRGREKVIYVEKGDDASCVLLPPELYAEERIFLHRIAVGALSPIQLPEVVEDARRAVV